ncbi:MAG: ATP phosphoribosyltransferase [SAR324 cluster bacterium]|nr:ATP phosphoribosyltransferase [SAR324 cluster bacterium]
MDIIKGKVLFAVPKKGRLYEHVMAYLKQADIAISRSSRSDVAICTSIPELAIFFIPAKDIAYFVGQGDVDFGITGLDVIKESKVKVEQLLNFDFGCCSLCLQAPIGSIKDISQLSGKKVVTSFPNLAKDYLSQQNLAKLPEIRAVSGSVEVACHLGLADAVIDLVQTGETMRAAGLELVDSILDSSPVLIANHNSPHKNLIGVVKRRLEGIKISHKYCLIEYNIKKENRYLGEKLTPGFQSPTVLALEDDAWVAIKSMVLKTSINRLLDELPKVGASAILVHGLENCRV